MARGAAGKMGGDVDLAGLGERGVIERIRRKGLVRPDGVVRGIGDDAAVFRLGVGRVAVVTTDLLVDGVHFRFDRSDPFTLGRKSLAVNLSDLAAMGARPREAFLGLAAPGSMLAESLDRFVDGFVEEGRLFGVNLLGGDLSSAPDCLVIAVTAVGDAVEDEVVLRSGARAGDALLTTGTLGDAAAGLAVLERGLEPGTPHHAAVLLAHERPRPHVEEGAFLAASGAVTAMIDVSDGIGTDLGHLLAESGGLGAGLEAARIPLSPHLHAVAAELGIDPLALALFGGEDYVLLLTAAEERAGALAADFEVRFGRPLHRVGKVEQEGGMRLLRDGRWEAVTDAGYQHWRRGA